MKFGKSGFQKSPNGRQYGAVWAKHYDSGGRQWRKTQGVGIVQVQSDQYVPGFNALPIDHLVRLS
jgi:hypothetical protein